MNELSFWKPLLLLAVVVLFFVYALISLYRRRVFVVRMWKKQIVRLTDAELESAYNYYTQKISEKQISTKNYEYEVILQLIEEEMERRQKKS